MESGPWDFGWEALVALGTLALAAVTAALAWSTRGLARLTSAEVNAQWRPILLPVGRVELRDMEPDEPSDPPRGPIERFVPLPFQRLWYRGLYKVHPPRQPTIEEEMRLEEEWEAQSEAERAAAMQARDEEPFVPEHKRFWISIPVRNEGTGPALAIRAGALLQTTYVGRGRWAPGRWQLGIRWAMPITLAPREETKIGVETVAGIPPDDPYWTPSVATIAIEYTDLAGRLYSTEMGSLVRGNLAEVRLLVNESSLPPDEYAPHIDFTHRLRRRRSLRQRVRAGFGALRQKPGEFPQPFRKRFRAARTAMAQTPRNQTFQQRLGWARIVFAKGYYPQLERSLWRRLKDARRAFRSMW